MFFIVGRYMVMRTLKTLDAAASAGVLHASASKVEPAQNKPKNSYNEDLKTTLYNFELFYEGTKRTLLVGLPEHDPENAAGSPARPLTDFPNVVRQDWSTDGNSDIDQSIRSFDSFLALIQKTVCKAHGVNAANYDKYPVKWRSLAEDGSECVYFKKPPSREKYTFELDSWLKQEGFPVFKIASVVVVEPASYSKGNERYIKLNLELGKEFFQNKKRIVAAPTKYASPEEEAAAKQAKADRAAKRKSEADRKLDAVVGDLQEQEAKKARSGEDSSA